MKKRRHAEIEILTKENYGGGGGVGGGGKFWFNRRLTSPLNPLQFQLCIIIQSEYGFPNISFLTLKNI